MALHQILCRRFEIHANVFQIPLIEACPQDGVDEFSRNMNSINVYSRRDWISKIPLNEGNLGIFFFYKRVIPAGFFLSLYFFLFYWFIVYCGWYGDWFWIGFM